jgi:PAS domain S-box-containing protein
MIRSPFLVNPEEIGYLGMDMAAKKPTPPTKRKKTAKPLILLQKKEVASETFQSIAELGNDGILVFDERHQIEFANRMASEITGYSNRELLNMSVLALLAKPHQSFVEDLFIHPERYGEKTCVEVQLPTSNGGIREAEICIALARTPLGTRKGYAYLRDITESKKMERKIREANQQFEKIAEMGDDGILVFDQAFKIIFANQMASEITGVPKEDLIGRNFFSVIGKEDKEFLEGTVTRGAGIGEKLCTEMSILTSEGRVKDAEVCIALAESDTGEVKTYAYIRDITERKRFERDLKDSEEKLRNLFERVRHGLFISSKEGKFLDCNQALLDMLGYPTKEEFLKIDIAQDLYVNPDDRKAFQERIEREGHVKDMEVEFKKKNGDKITVLMTSHPIKNEKGEVIGYQGINLDISERKRIENQLREANEFFMNLIESSVDGIIAADMKGNIFIFNKGAEVLTGYKADEVIGKLHITKIYREGVAKEIMKKLRSQEYGGVGKFIPTQMSAINKFGQEIPIQLSAALIYNGSDQEIASVGIFTDLRPRLNMERKLQETHLQLVSSEKMASLGKLAAGIAHEINNPLGGILIYSSLMMEDLPGEDPRRGDLVRIVQEAGRCKEIVKSLLEFARQTEPKMEPTDVNRAISDGLFFLVNQALFHNIHIVKNLDSFLPFVQGNAGQLKQVFMNIIVNAAEAMHGNGTLTITTFRAPDRKTVFVEFADTGEGIPAENLTRIFDPFFTTKEVGKGTGLGLATSYGIIEDHGGKISVKSQVEKGTTFTIELPVHQGTQAILESPSVQDQGVNDGAKHTGNPKGESFPV